MVSLTVDIMAVYFLFILLLGDKEIKIHAAIIFASCALNVVFPLELATDLKSYISNRESYIMLDGATALILSMFLNVDKTAWKQALLLAFATLCHIMIILNIKAHHAGFFYNWYDELIIAVGLLQMMVSHDGLIGAFSNLQELLLRTHHYFNRAYQGLFTHKISEKSK